MGDAQVRGAWEQAPRPRELGTWGLTAPWAALSWCQGAGAVLTTFRSPQVWAHRGPSPSLSCSPPPPTGTLSFPFQNGGVGLGPPLSLWAAPSRSPPAQGPWDSQFPELER